jgi:hypothetical protein
MTTDQNWLYLAIWHTQIDENGSLKATKHDKYENIAGSV